jgi:hypothetical protein
MRKLSSILGQLNSADRDGTIGQNGMRQMINIIIFDFLKILFHSSSESASES